MFLSYRTNERAPFTFLIYDSKFMLEEKGDSMYTYKYTGIKYIQSYKAIYVRLTKPKLPSPSLSRILNRCREMRGTS